MKELSNYTKRIFLVTGNVRDEILLSDNRRVHLDRFLFIYLKHRLKYDAVIFLDTKGIYFFDHACRDALSKNKQKKKDSAGKGLEKLLRHPAVLRLPQETITEMPVAEQRLRLTYGGNITEISQFMMSHLQANNVSCAVVVYDGTMFNALEPASPVWIQMQGVLRTGMDHLSSSNRNIFVWVDGDEYETLSRRFQRLGLDFLFNVPQSQENFTGRAVRITVSPAGGDEIQRLLSLRAIKGAQYPDFEDIVRYAPVISGIMRQRHEPLKTFCQRLGEKQNFWEHVQHCYELKTDQSSAEEELEKMIGMRALKEEIHRLVNGIEKKEVIFEEDFELIPARFKTIKVDSLPYIPHIALLGNPGTGKTTVARLIGRILREKGILESGHMVEVTPKDLVAGYMGQTAIKTDEQVRKALGGVLFIDEAYELAQDERDFYGSQGLTVLVKAMSDYQGKFMMIFAGYPYKTKTMLKQNPGTARRVKLIELPDYSAEELEQIMKLLLEKQSLKSSPEVFESAGRFCQNLLANRDQFGGNDFGNADVVVTQIARAAQKARSTGSGTLLVDHFDHPDYFRKEILDEEDLDQLIGIEEVKRNLKTLFKRVNIEENAEPGHYIFTGNPGTGKTVVGRQMARKFYEIGLLKSAKLNSYSASELIVDHVGGTETRMGKILNDSLDGVLLIDEAHQLASGSQQNQYGANALQAILPFMENNRKRFCLIFAGYPGEMEKLFPVGPRPKGPFKKAIAFPGLHGKEPVAIFHKMFQKETAYQMEGNQDVLFREMFSSIRVLMGKKFNNGRMIRNYISNLKDKAIEDTKTGDGSVIIREKHIRLVCEEWK